MKRVEVRLNLEAVAPLLDVMREVAEELRPELPVPQQVPEHDEDLVAQWREDLLKSQRDDLAVLLAMFDSEFFITGLIALDEENGDAVLRACAALRLRLRSKHLGEVGDENLETGDLTLEEMPEEQRRSYATYVFLATLQELIVQHLDPTEME
jgi:hypothetical protein